MFAESLTWEEEIEVDEEDDACGRTTRGGQVPPPSISIRASSCEARDPESLASPWHVDLVLGTPAVAIVIFGRSMRVALFAQPRPVLLVLSIRSVELVEIHMIAK